MLGNIGSLGHVIFAVVLLQLRPARCLKGDLVILRVHIDLVIRQSNISVLLRLHGVFQRLEAGAHLRQVFGQIGAGIAIRASAKFNIHLNLCVGTDQAAHGAEFFSHAVFRVAVYLLHLLLGGHDRLLHFFILRCGACADVSGIRSNGTHAEIILTGCHKAAVIVLCIGIVRVEQGNASVAAVDSRLQRICQQSAVIELGRPQGQAVNTIGLIRQVDEVAPLQIRHRNIVCIDGSGFINVILLRQLAGFVTQCNLQAAVCRQIGADIFHFRSPGQRDPRKGR